MFWYTLCSWPTVGTVAVMSLAPLLILALELLGGDWGRSLMDSPTTWPVIAVACLVPLIAGPVLFARPGRRRLNSGLRRMGFPICVKCDYDLKGLAENPSPIAARSAAPSSLTCRRWGDRLAPDASSSHRTARNRTNSTRDER